MFTVLCINNRNPPNEIPSSVWSKLIEGEEYTVIRVMKLNIQGGILGYELAEIDLKPYSPYEYFAAHRFAIPVKPTDNITEEELVKLEEELLV